MFVNSQKQNKNNIFRAHIRIELIIYYIIDMSQK